MSRIEEAILKLKSRAQTRDESVATDPSSPVSTPPARAVSSAQTVEGTREVPVTDGARRAARSANAKRITIDANALRAEGLLAPRTDERRIAHEFRSIKRALLANVTGRAAAAVPLGNLMMVASALPGDGKTFSAVNLALSLALEKDFSVVLVDADVAKPNVSRALGIESEPGLLDALADPQVDFHDVEIGTNIEGLTVVPAGLRQDTSSELISSDRMAQLLRGIADERGRLFVFDSSPLLLTNEARALAELVGQVVLVVRANATPKSAVREALERIPSERYVGLVFNERRAGSTDSYYGYGNGEYMK